jgi:hypothetical protein
MKSIVIILVIVLSVTFAPFAAKWFTDSMQDLNQFNQEVMEKYK